MMMIVLSTIEYLAIMITICLVEHLYLLGVVIVPVGHVVHVQPVVLQVQPGVRPPAPYLYRKYFTRNPTTEGL